MTDHAAIVRDALNFCSSYASYASATASLDALVAERNEAQNLYAIFRERYESKYTEWDASKTNAVRDAEAELFKANEVRRVLTEVLHDVWRSYTLLDVDQAHLDHSMEAVERLLFGPHEMQNAEVAP